MSTDLETVLAPAEVAALPSRDLAETVCVVFDVFRATSTVVTALANGAAKVIPVSEIPEAIALRQRYPEVSLAGERDGFRIGANLTGGLDFDFGNSPREFTREKIQGRTIVLSTTNGSRAIRACGSATAVLICSFLNLDATAQFLRRHPAARLLMVCSGTIDQASYEDVLGAGALTDLIWPAFSDGKVSDSARIALQIYRLNRENLMDAVEHCRNGRRLLSIPELRDDVPWCLRRDFFPLVAKLEGDAIVKIDP